MREAAMRLSELLTPWQSVPADADREVAGLALDSRELRPGDAFVALPGRHSHGLAHLDEALAAGAVAVLTEDGEAPVASVPVVPVPGLRGRLGELAARLYGHPAEALPVIGVTGTNGKTSVAAFLAQALAADGPVGHLGTLGQGLWGDLESTRHTTPDVFGVHRRLAQARDAGAVAAVMEVSSHALDQGRVDGVRFAAAVFTQLGRDHLDYHGDLAAYGAAKARLFRTPGLGAAVLNLDDPFAAGLATDAPRWGYRLGTPMGAREVGAEGLRCDAGGLAFDLVHGGRRASIATGLLGRFQAHNLLAAATALLALGHELDEIARRLSRVQAPPGRMEPYRAPGRPLVVVDYAHTPDALAAALDSLRAHVRGRLWCVFGAGGERDRGKRPLMARAAEARADALVLTDDNPRGEAPEAIVADLRAGLSGAVPAAVVHDRAEAIAHALAQADPEDAVLVAGKGHEDYQEIAGTRRPHSDRETVARLLGVAP